VFLLACISNSLIRGVFLPAIKSLILWHDAVTPFGRRNWSLQIRCCWAGIHSSGIDVQSVADAVRLIKQAQSVRQGPPQALMFVSRAVKGTKLKTEAMGVKPGCRVGCMQDEKNTVLFSARWRISTQATIANDRLNLYPIAKLTTKQ
jgi:hypothetical protein